MLLTIVIPAYNEGERITSTLIDIISSLTKRDLPYEIIVVDDGSIDNTVKLVEDIKCKYPQISLLKLGRNFGKGKAVREGMLKGKGDYLLFLDADNSTSIEEFEKFFPRVKQRKDIIIGTRKIKGAEIIEHQSFLREFFGKGFSWLSNVFTQAHVSDFTCGFKCFSQKAVKDIFSKAVINDWSFDAEILFIARKLGYEITEVPVRWKNDKSSKVKLLRDIVNSFKGLLKIRLYNIQRRYGK